MFNDPDFKVKMRRFSLMKITLVALVSILFVLPLSCAGDSSSGASSANDDAVNDDVNDDDTEDDVDDDADDDVNDDTDGGPYLAEHDSDGVQDMWCQNLGTVPPESGWVWKERFLYRWEYEDSGTPQGFVTYSGDTLYGLWRGYDESIGASVGFLGRLEGDQWTQWQIEEPEDTCHFSGLVTDSNGEIWSVLFAPSDAGFTKMCNIVRWEEGQIAEVIPVFNDIAYHFIKLFILQDDRFAFTYYNGAGAFSIVEQTSEGDFISMIMNGTPGSTYRRPDSTGVWRDMFAFSIFDNLMLFENFGTIQSGFQSLFLGFAPESPSGGVYGLVIDHDDNIFSTQQFGGYFGDYYYLVKYNGSSVVYDKWMEEPGWDFDGNPIMGINALSQPYFIVVYDLPDDLPENRLCMLTHTDNGTSSSLIGSIEGTSYPQDVAYSNSNEIALIGDNHLVFGPSEMTLYHRQRDEKGN
jgi:hypothetical protein